MTQTLASFAQTSKKAPLKRYGFVSYVILMGAERVDCLVHKLYSFDTKLNQVRG